MVFNHSSGAKKEIFARLNEVCMIEDKLIIMLYREVINTLTMNEIFQDIICMLHPHLAQKYSYQSS